MVMIGETYRLTVLGLSAACCLDVDQDGATLFFPRHTKLGRRLLAGAPDPVRAIAANYIRQAKGWPRAQGAETPIRFIGV